MANEGLGAACSTAGEKADALPAVLPEGKFEGRVAFRQLVRDALACAAREGWRELVVCDATFEDWPLGERDVIASLQAWARGGRRFVMIARRYDHMTPRHARFVEWRKTWSHIIECHGCPSADPLELPSALWSPGWTLRRLDVERCTGVTGTDPQRRVQLRENLAEWARRSTPAFPATTLGL